MADDRKKPKNLDPSLKDLWELQQARRKDRDQYTSRRKLQGAKLPPTLAQGISAFFAKDPETRKKLQENLAIAAWTKIVGETAARYSRAVRVRSQTLYVNVDDPLWMQQLTFLKQAIIEKYRAEFPQSGIRDLYFFRERPMSQYSDRSRTPMSGVSTVRSETKQEK